MGRKKERGSIRRDWARPLKETSFRFKPTLIKYTVQMGKIEEGDGMRFNMLMRSRDMMWENTNIMPGKKCCRHHPASTWHLPDLCSRISTQLKGGSLQLLRISIRRRRSKQPRELKRSLAERTASWTFDILVDIETRRPFNTMRN